MFRLALLFSSLAALSWGSSSVDEALQKARGQQVPGVRGGPVKAPLARVAKSREIGLTTVQVVTHGQPEHGITYLNVHYDEESSIEATKKLIQEDGGRFVVIEHHPVDRYIKFSIVLNGRKREFGFDPNRIFTHQGIKTTLAKDSRPKMAPEDVPSEAVDAVAVFAKTLLNEDLKGARVIIAVHNNWDGGYGALDYLPAAKRKKYGLVEKDGRAVDGGEYINAATDSVKSPLVKDPDHFFFVTHRALFNALKNDYNVILQNNAGAKDDGSLSVYCGNPKLRLLGADTIRPGAVVPYINVEAQRKHTTVQYKMLKFLSEILRGG